MDFSFDYSHLIGSSPVAAVILYVAVKVLKPLLSEYLSSMVSAVKANTESIEELIASEKRASQHNHAEHSEMIALLRVLTDSLLRLNEQEPKGQEKGEDLASRISRIESYLREEASDE